MQEIIGYHGTFQEFSEFLLPEHNNKNVRFNKGYLGIYFTESYKVARNFTKEHWYIRTSKHFNGARVIKAKLSFSNPRIIIPNEHSSLNLNPMQILGLRNAYLKRGFDSMIIDSATDSENFIMPMPNNKTISPYISEYHGKQFVMFHPSQIEILEIKTIPQRCRIYRQLFAR